MRQKKWVWWLIWAALFVFSGAVIKYTYDLCRLGDWTLENLSVVGYWHGHEKELQLWGWLTGLFFVGFMTYLIQMYRYRGKPGFVFTALAGIFLVTGVYIPFDPDWSEIGSNIHIAISFCAPVALVGAIATFGIFLGREHQVRTTLFWAVMIPAILVAAFLLLKYGIVTSVLELYVVIACAVFLNGMSLLGLFRKFYLSMPTKAEK